MVDAGVIDPTKVARCALQNASSVSGLMLTTEVMVTDIPEPKSETPMPGGHDHGMGGWVAWAECTKFSRSIDRCGKGLGALAPRLFFCYELGMGGIPGFEFRVSGFKKAFFSDFRELPEI